MAIHKSAKGLVTLNSWPHLSELGDEVLFIFDKVLLKKSPGFKEWISKASLQYPVQAGESLKSLHQLPSHIEAIVRLTQNSSSRKLTICVIGGGSVGDFGGFIASVLKRGVGLIHIPSTWLAAIDSAHGGKTALNVGVSKNQIGTFYPAKKVYLIKELLISQPSERTFEAFGELFKIALLAGGPFWQNFASERHLDSELLWKYLPLAIRAKLHIVAKDPIEVTGHRHLLNLGHTVGHALELYKNLPHGIAINYGISFSLRWSQQRGLLGKKSWDNLYRAPLAKYLLSISRDRLLKDSSKTFTSIEKLLLTDKKKTASAKLRFIFLKAPGKPIIQEVTVREILEELKRQNSESDNDV